MSELDKYNNTTVSVFTRFHVTVAGWNLLRKQLLITGRKASEQLTSLFVAKTFDKPVVFIWVVCVGGCTSINSANC